jgi:signal recognition particle subunit SRP72
MKLYNQVMKHRQSDVALAAVASNNIITINKDQNVFDSKKKIKVATAEGLKQKLVSDQRRTIAMNECLLYMYMGQGDHCRRLAQVLRTSYPNCDTPSLIEAAQCLREKNSGKAIECLQSQVDNEKIDVLHMKLALAQLFLSQEHIYNACDVLRSLGDFSYTPGVVSTLVTLYSSQEDKESAADVLSKAIDWYHANDPKSVHLPTLIRASANFHLHLGSPQVAAQMLEELHRQNPSDLKTLAQLISAYAKFDPSRAHAVSKQLPSVDTLAKDIDVDALEASLSLLSSKYVKKSTTSGGKVEPSPRPGQPPAGRTDVEVSAKRKNKKKKKKVLPKNYDPNATPDPERWLPLRERSYYRGKRKNRKREIGKGTQGVAQASSELDASKSTSSPPNSQISSPKSGTSSTTTAAAQQPSTSATTPNQSGAGPRQQKPQAAKQRPGGGGGKKKKGVKW